MQAEQIVTIKSLVQRIKSDPIFKGGLGFDYFDKTPSEATFNRFINLLAGTDILEKNIPENDSQCQKAWSDRCFQCCH